MVRGLMIPDSLKEPIARYAALEQDIGALVAKRSAVACARCEKVCCRPDVGQQVLQSWWLTEVSRHVHGKWWPDDWETAEQCVALTGNGCMLTAGKPMICWSFVCDLYTEVYSDLFDAAFYSFLADLLWEVGQLTKKLHLEYATEQDALKHAEKITERVAWGRALLDEARGLKDGSLDEVGRHRLLLSLLCRVPRFFRATTQRALLARLGS